MYVVVVTHKIKEPLSDLVCELNKEFPNERFYVTGSEGTGFQLRIEGVGDELKPRAFSKTYLKTWKPKPVEDL